jgi:hypothetical protein
VQPDGGPTLAESGLCQASSGQAGVLNSSPSFSTKNLTPVPVPSGISGVLSKAQRAPALSSGSPASSPYQ